MDMNLINRTKENKNCKMLLKLIWKAKMMNQMHENINKTELKEMSTINKQIIISMQIRIIKVEKINILQQKMSKWGVL